MSHRLLTNKHTSIIDRENYVRNICLAFKGFILLALQSLCAYELGIVTMFRNEAPYLAEWIEYHHMIGVDHFLLYNDRSDDEWAEVLEPYIKSNLVEVIDWPNFSRVCLFPNHQVAAYKDGLRRSKGNAKWLAFIDIDEFILPKKNKKITSCLDQFFSSAAGVYICWLNFGTGGVYLNPKNPILTNLTSCSRIHHPKNSSGKSIVKVDEVEVDQLSSPHFLKLKKGSQYYNGSGLPLDFKNDELQINSTHTSDYIQINHYGMRDENYFLNVRLPRTKPQPLGEYQLELHVLLEQYKNFNLEKNYQIIKFIKNNYPSRYKEFWSKTS
ncbi:MAG: glycosyltransferase [Chlamydiae bacterium]|nr:glycosyltransferase [Chlamydiota bacterium]